MCYRVESAFVLICENGKRTQIFPYAPGTFVSPRNNQLKGRRDQDRRLSQSSEKMGRRKDSRSSQIENSLARLPEVLLDEPGYRARTDFSQNHVFHTIRETPTLLAQLKFLDCSFRINLWRTIRVL